MSNKREKLCVAGMALIFLLAAMGTMAVGTFLPKWARMKNATVYGNVSFSLWTRQECFGIICVTTHVPVQWTNEDCWVDRDTGQERCEKTTGTRIKVDTKCREANFCNSTWTSGGDADFEKTPSTLMVAKFFETPALGFAVACIVLYVIKIVLLVKHPTTKRQHLKAAYLTCGAIAGVVAIVGVILFCTMLEGDKYEQLWAPYLNLAGGIIFFLFGFGGYLRWRDRTADHDFDDDTSLCERELHEIRASAAVLRQTSQTSAKAAEAKL